MHINTAEKLVEEARDKSEIKPDVGSPKTSCTDVSMKGGKPDDITTIVSQIYESDTLVSSCIQNKLNEKI